MNGSRMSITAAVSGALLLGVLGWRLAADVSAAPAAPVSRPSAHVAADPWAEPAEPERAALLYDRFETLTTADGLPSNKVTTVLAAGDDLWVGTDRGLGRRRDGEWRTWSEADGLGHRYVTSLALDPRTGDLWVSTLRGLSRLSGGAIRTYTQLTSGLMNDVVYQVVTDGELVWAATAAGTSALDLSSGAWVLYDHENSIMHEPWCYSIALGPARTWIGIWGGGVVELDRTTGRWREYRDPDHEMELDLLRDDGPLHDVSSFVAWGDGLLWQATYFGLSRYDGKRWRTFRKADTGLPGDFINHVAARGRTAFLGTDEGFGVLDGETAVTYQATEGGGCEVTVHRDGELVEVRRLPTGPGDNYILWTQPGDGEVWIATAHGLSRGISSAGSTESAENPKEEP
jgi:ligand-binding sensor domain-containing protein